MHMHFSLTLCEIRTTKCSVVPECKYVGKIISSLDMKWYIRECCALELTHCYLFLTNIPFHTVILGSIYLSSHLVSPESWLRGIVPVVLSAPTFWYISIELLDSDHILYLLYFWPLWMLYVCFSMHALMCVHGGKLSRIRYITPQT